LFIVMVTALGVSLLLAGSGTGAFPVTRPATSGGGPGVPQRFEFHRSVANVEFVSSEMEGRAPIVVKRAPAAGGTVWWGRIMRRLPGEGPHDSDHFVPFMVEYVQGIASRVWCDSNLDDDLTDDPPIVLSLHPGDAEARSFLAVLHWKTAFGGADVPVRWRVRVVLEPVRRFDKPPIFRAQMVFGMTGTVTLGGRTHQAVLFDGNGDGLYTKAFLDGIFVDLDDDRRIDTDPMSPGFGPFDAPFRMGGRIYEVTSVDPRGTELTLRDEGVAQAEDSVQAQIGRPAPRFSYRDLAGREVRLEDYRGRVVLLYFWASWCGSCLTQAPEIRSIYERHKANGLQILGVSFDTDRAAMEKFRAEQGQTWPTSFSGLMLWDDPVGRLYEARGPCVVYLVDRDGKLEGTYVDLAELDSRLGDLMPDAIRAAR
jgi:thiol-disulfide isomerase/thioredoxin